MPQVINTNIASLNAQRNLNQSQSSLATALQRLSSGLRINMAKDDAAGMAISDRMTSQIRGLDQAQRNSNDGISLAQTAEGAMVNVSDNLQRIRELAVQSANASNTSSDRASINQEVQQLLDEIDRVATTTQFNGQNLLDGTFSQAQFQVGANANQTIGITMNSVRTANIGTGETSALTSSGKMVTATVTASTLNTGDLIINGVQVGPGIPGADTASNKTYSDVASSAISKVAAINAVSSQTGVTAAVATNVMAGITQSGPGAAGVITINGVSVASTTTGANFSTNRQTVIAAINQVSAQTGVVAIDTGADASGVRLEAVDGRNISISYTAAAWGLAAGLQLTGSSQYGSYTLSSAQEITIAQGAGGTLANAGLVTGTYAPQMAYTVSTSNNGAALVAGDAKINGILVGASLSTYDTASTASATGSAIAKAAAINKLTATTGVTATANANRVAGASQTAASLTGTITINGVTTGAFSTTTDAAASRAATVAAINAMTAQTGVTATDTGSTTNGVSLTAADGRNIVVSFAALTSAATGVAVAGTKFGTISLTSAKAFTVDMGTTATFANLGVGAGTYGTGKNGQSLSTLDVSTVEGANAALAAVDNALTQINSARAALGAFQNRFASTVSTLQATSENLSAARSRIRDADFAQETANMTRAQILQQAGVAMLAQANALPNTVLSLLK